MLDVRFPERASWTTFLMPSIDVLALLVVLMLCGAWQKRLPRWAMGAVIGFIMASRLLRIADGVEQGAYLRSFIVSLDLPLLPELVRLMYATLSSGRFVLACLALLLGLAGAAFLVQRALRVAERELAVPAMAGQLCGLIAVLSVLAAFLPPQTVLASSLLPRWTTELGSVLSLPSYRAAQLARIEGVRNKLRLQPHDLEQLRGRNVYVFLIESYGQAVLDRPELFSRVQPEYQRFESDLSARGFETVSRLLDSPTYGGRSWLAQATLLTGVPARDQLQFELLRAAQPESLAQIFAAAGYRTVLAQPGTVRETSAPDLFHFEQRYVAADFGYRGPRFGWATMPDQFVLEAVRRRELAAREPGARPLFLTYALVSSHVRWSDLPPIVDDWSSLGDGSRFGTWPRQHYATNWLSLAGASAAYADSIVYDLEVLRRYLLEFVTDDSLVIILGDHQPHSDVTRQGPSPGVPVHVLSRNSAFIDRFRARGYTAGMFPDRGLAHPGLDRLLLDLVADFSSGPAAANAPRFSSASSEREAE